MRSGWASAFGLTGCGAIGDTKQASAIRCYDLGPDNDAADKALNDIVNRVFADVIGVTAITPRKDAYR